MAEQLVASGIIRYASLITPSAPRDIEKRAYNATILIHEDDPKIQEIKTAIKACVDNSEVDIKALSKKDTFYVPLVKCSEDDPVFSKYYSLKVKTNEFNKKGEPMTPPSVHWVQETPKPVYEKVTDPAFDSDLTGRIGHFIFTLASYKFSGKGGVGGYLQRVAVSRTQYGEIPVDQLRTSAGAEEAFAGLLGEAAPRGTSTETEGFSEVVAPPRTVPAVPKPPTGLPVHQMTAKAECGYQDYRSAGWSDEQLISNGLMLPPGGVTPSFV